MIKIVLTPSQEQALIDIEAGNYVHPSTRRSLIRLGFLTREGSFTYRVDRHRNGETTYKPEKVLT